MHICPGLGIRKVKFSGVVISFEISPVLCLYKKKKKATNINDIFNVYNFIFA